MRVGVDVNRPSEAKESLPSFADYFFDREHNKSKLAENPWELAAAKSLKRRNLQLNYQILISLPGLKSRK